MVNTSTTVSCVLPHPARAQIDGAHRWRIDADTCFRYWNTVGTDCGRCVTVCPYSHPDNLAHNLVRWGVARGTMLWLDDLLYGGSPEPGPAPSWIPPAEDSD